MPKYKVRARYIYEEVYEIEAPNKQDAIEQAEKNICEDAVIWGEYEAEVLDINKPDGDKFFEVGGIKLERNKVYTAVKVVYDTPFCGTTETGYYIFPDGISEAYDFNDLFSESDAIAHAESFGYSFEDYLEENVDGYDPENSEDFDSDGYYDSYVVSVMENCYCEEHEVCEADGDLDDADYMYVLTPDGSFKIEK